MSLGRSHGMSLKARRSGMTAALRRSAAFPTTILASAQKDPPPSGKNEGEVPMPNVLWNASEGGAKRLKDFHTDDSRKPAATKTIRGWRVYE
jgi:hypothetical protein